MRNVYMSDCPIECINLACPERDWLEKHEGFIITIVGIFGTGLGVLLTYFLKSRCRRISCCGCSCDRTPVDLPQVEVVN